MTRLIYLTWIKNLSPYLWLRLIVRIKQHFKNWWLLVLINTVVALWPQVMLSVPPCPMGPGASFQMLMLLIFQNSQLLVLPLPIPLHAIVNPPQLPFCPIGVNVVITTTIPCHRFQAPGTRMGPVRPESHLHTSWGKALSSFGTGVSCWGHISNFPLILPPLE